MLRRVGAAIVKAAKREATVVASVLDHVAEQRPASAEALAEGLVLGAYRYGEYKDADESVKLTEVVVAAKGGKTVAAALEKGVQVAAAVSLARDLVNEPGGSLTPTAFAKRAEQAAEAAGLTIEVLDKAAIEKAKLGGLLGVNRGSTQPPRFLKISHEPAKARGFLALVGKGITFDSGGLSLKTADGMIGMKGDMGGAAAVLGALVAAPVVAPRLKVVGYIPLTDNMVGGDATRVGDVLRARNGKTIEVLNTDAEGRLVLADALSLATEDEPDAIVDLATLTGACMVALGDRTAGLMGNHDGWIEQVEDAVRRRRRAGLAPAAAQAHPQGPRLRHRRPPQHPDRPVRRCARRRAVPRGVRRRRHRLGPPRHRRPGLGLRAPRRDPQGRHRLRRPHPRPPHGRLQEAGPGDRRLTLRSTAPRSRTRRPTCGAEAVSL